MKVAHFALEGASLFFHFLGNLAHLACQAFAGCL